MKFFGNAFLTQALALTLLLGLPVSGMGQTVSVQTELRASADTAAKVVKSLEPKTPVKVLQRQGFWLEVEAQGAKGWLKGSTVDMGSGPKGLSGLDTGRSGKGNIVSTSAARGLSPKELVAAKPDFQQADQLQGLAVTPKASEEFAAKGGLQARKLALLSPPAAAQSAKGSSSKKGKKSDKDEDDDGE
ncbi:MAG: hypothetical protein EBQ76_01735 [Betaproteobacteria bacterium]|nr:hypothetical protein [Betaproteobacteria bacterium]